MCAAAVTCEKGFFDWDQCACACNNPEDGDPTVDCPEKKYFNWNSCQCECRPEFYPEVGMWEEHPDWILNTDTCEWECAPHACLLEGHYWDTVLCECRCLDQTCPENYHWDQYDCECVCNGEAEA